MKRRLAVALPVIAAIMLVALLALRWALRPDVLGPRVLAMAGTATGLELRAGTFDYRLRGMPQLVARDFSARAPGDSAPLLVADRMLVAVPWSTLRSRGADLRVQRIELDAPRLDLPAFLAWWDTRPAGDGRLPLLEDGLRIVQGMIHGDGWRLSGLGVDVPSFAPDSPMRAALRGDLQAEGVLLPFQLQLALTRPASGAGIGLAGHISPQGDAWHAALDTVASARLHLQPTLRLAGLRVSAHGRTHSAGLDERFALGLAAEATATDAGMQLQPAALTFRGQGMLPVLRTSGRAAIGNGATLALAGQLAQWPADWPPLPPPLDQSRSPLPFNLDYSGPTDLSAPLALQLRRDQAVFQGRLHLARLLAWMDNDGGGSPLPPLEGSVRAARLDIAGARLHGVEIEVSAADPEQP